MFELRPQRFDRHGLKFAINALCEEVAREAGFVISVDVPDTRFDGVIEELCYRTVREAVVNARKHSGASHLWVRISATMRWSSPASSATTAGGLTRAGSIRSTCACTWGSRR